MSQIKVDVPFAQRNLLGLNEHKKILYSEGACSGFNLEITRWVMKHIAKGESEDNINVMAKFNKELSNPKKARNFVKRLALYQIEQQDTVSPEVEIEYQKNYFLNSLPDDFKNKKFLGLSFNGFNQDGLLLGRHTIHIRKIGDEGDKYEVIDINYGSKRCANKDDLNHHIESILNHYQGSAVSVEEKEIKIYDIEKIVKTHDLLPNKDKSKKENKAKKYKLPRDIILALKFPYLNHKLINELINSGSDLNQKDDDGNTALIYAVQREDLSIVNSLLRAGVDVDAQSKNGKTALMHAVQSGNANVIISLLSEKINVNLQDENGFTALMYAIIKGDRDIVGDLLKAKANPNAKDSGNVTALMYASMIGDASIVSDLLRAGADINAQAKSGETALDAALSAGHIEVVKLLESEIKKIEDRKIRNLVNKEIVEKLKIQPSTVVMFPLNSSGESIKKIGLEVRAHIAETNSSESIVPNNKKPSSLSRGE